MKHTDIGDCGRVRFFIDSRFEHVIRPYFSVAGLDDLVIPVDVVSHVKHADSRFGNTPYSSFFRFFRHPDVEACRYALKLDTKIMMLNIDALPNFSFKELCQRLDTETGLFGHFHPTTFHKFEAWTVNGYQTSESDKAYIRKAIQGLPEPVRHMSGQCVGLRLDSPEAEKLLLFYEKHGSHIPHDEGFLLFFLSYYPDVEGINFHWGLKYSEKELREICIKQMLVEGTAMFQRSGHHLLDFDYRNEGYQHIDHLTSGLESVWKFYEKNEGVIEVDGTEARYLHP